MKKAVCAILLAGMFCILPQNGEAKSKKAVVVKENKPATTVQTSNNTQTTQHLTIVGDPIASKEQAVNFIKKFAPDAQLNCSVEEIVELYYQEAMAEGIRPDIALSQALLETGFFRYGGDVKAYQNNFCGLGSVGGGVKGATFKTPELGVRAHIQHLLVYSRKEPPKTKIVDPRYDMVKKRSDIYGVCVTWHDLDGRWAAKGVPYGARILNIHERLLNTEPKNKVVVKEQPKKEEEKQTDKQEQSSDKRQKMRDKVREILSEKVK